MPRLSAPRPAVRRPRRAARLGALLLGCLLPLAALGQQLTVSAAASLQNAFRDIGPAFERAHPGVRLQFNFAASGPLLVQIAQGAPVDVFASADQETMDRAQAQQLLRAGSRADFAGNQLVLVSPLDSAPLLRSLADLARPGVSRIAIGNPLTVPAGRYARASLAGQRLLPGLQPKLIHADSVRQALNYVSRGEVDAGFVYRTDALLERGRVRIDLVVPTAPPPTYPIAVVAASPRHEAAARFIAFVLGPAGQAVLQQHGFDRPPAGG